MSYVVWSMGNCRPVTDTLTAWIQFVGLRFVILRANLLLTKNPSRRSGTLSGGNTIQGSPPVPIAVSRLHRNAACPRARMCAHRVWTPGLRRTVVQNCGRAYTSCASNVLSTYTDLNPEHCTCTSRSSVTEKSPRTQPCHSVIPMDPKERTRSPQSTLLGLRCTEPSADLGSRDHLTYCDDANSEGTLSPRPTCRGPPLSHAGSPSNSSLPTGKGPRNHQACTCLVQRGPASRRASLKNEAASWSPPRCCMTSPRMTQASALSALSDTSLSAHASAVSVREVQCHGGPAHADAGTSRMAAARTLSALSPRLPSPSAVGNMANTASTAINPGTNKRGGPTAAMFSAIEKKTGQGAAEILWCQRPK
eukprot:m.185405 g.185405  ORF g.185405 m.185405 type:complete len:364 (-) comp18116_c0_seq7:1952-3043(-)